jgi:hypothetical protein
LCVSLGLSLMSLHRDAHPLIPSRFAATGAPMPGPLPAGAKSLRLP